jgi:hypothetical protein
LNPARRDLRKWSLNTRCPPGCRQHPDRSFINTCYQQRNPVALAKVTRRGRGSLSELHPLVSQFSQFSAQYA